jgi:S-methylmethionine-dependent homocysteine/selenocysteine methylase
MKTVPLKGSPDQIAETMKLPGPVALLDGSMGQELINRGVTGHGLLWSAGALLASPDTVRDVHLDYISAGADIITTNTYSTNRVVLAQAGIENRFSELNELACRLAVEARDHSGRPVLIAGSLPPFGESYRPDLVGAFDEIEPLYREHAQLLAPHVDLILCETMSSAEEALAAATGASVTGKPVWVSWTIADEGKPVLRSGESIEQACQAIAGLEIDAMLLNCSLPEAITAGLPTLAAMTDKPVGAYGNAFTPIPPMWEHHEDEDLPPARTDLGRETYSGFAQQWINSGARIVGGCCEIGPAHIAELRKLIDSIAPD